MPWQTNRVYEGRRGAEERRARQLTDDEKEDWVLWKNSQTVAPRSRWRGRMEVVAVRRRLWLLLQLWLPLQLSNDPFHVRDLVGGL